MYFYTKFDSAIPSPLYFSLADMIGSSGFHHGCRIWRGTHDAPVPLSMDEIFYFPGCNQDMCVYEH